MRFRQVPSFRMHGLLGRVNWRAYFERLNYLSSSPAPAIFLIDPTDPTFHYLRAFRFYRHFCAMPVPESRPSRNIRASRIFLTGREGAGFSFRAAAIAFMHSTRQLIATRPDELQADVRSGPSKVYNPVSARCGFCASQRNLLHFFSPDPIVGKNGCSKWHPFLYVLLLLRYFLHWEKNLQQWTSQK